MSIRLPHDLWTKLNEMVENKIFSNLSDAVRSLTEGGLWLHEHKDSLQSNQELKKIIDEYNSKMNEKAIFEWTKSLSDTQIDGIKMALELEKDDRCG